MCTYFLDNSIHVIIIVLLADLFLRLFKLFREYFVYANYYLPQKRLRQILARVFSYNKPTIALLLCTAFISLWCYGNKVFYHVLPHHGDFAYMLLYWLYHAVNFSYSRLDYAYFLRGNHGLDYAQGMAANFFHGYIKLTMPSNNEHPGIRERIDLYMAKNRVEFAIKRLIILVPSTMFVSSVIESRLLDKAAPLELISKNRAGVFRPFQNDVYRFNVPINGKFYYIALEGATPMLSFYEAMHFQNSTTWQMREMKRDIWLKFYKHLHKLVNNWEETKNEVELVLYNTLTADGRSQDVGEVLLAHIKHLWDTGRDNP